jgi:predicted nucleic acid-binding protein
MITFVDTSALIALTDRRDTYHQEAVAVQKQFRAANTRLVTSTYVISETITWLRYNLGHAVAVDFGNKILASSVVTIKDIDDAHFVKAFELFKKFEDQAFSFTDCTSFALMKSLKLKQAFTFDAHFSIMGFILIR